MRAFGFIYLLFLTISEVNAQTTDQAMEPLLQVPREYTILKTSVPPTIDGKNLEAGWAQAPWSESFEDIEGRPEKKPVHSTRFKLLWDKDYLYVYTQFEEKHIWAKLKEHDQSVFQDNALEIFIDPDGDTHNYVEFQINALETVWDLIMTKPYRNGGLNLTDWDIKGLKKAVHVNGSLNKSDDEDKYWSIELAIPLKSFRFSGNNTFPKEGSIWRMNLTRVQWETDIVNGIYIKKKGPNGRAGMPVYTCWAPPGIINFHYPERWGYVRFGGELSEKFLDPGLEQSKLSLWKYYYLQQEYKTKNGIYALNADELRSAFPGVNIKNVPYIKIISTPGQFSLQLPIPPSGILLTLDNEGKFLEKPIP